MSNGMSSWRRRRAAARTRRALDRAMAVATTPSMEQELVALSSGRQFLNVTR